MAQDWDIKACGRSCRATGEPFADGQHIFSRILFGPDGYVREDYSAGGWREELGQGALSFWRGAYRAPPPPTPEPIKRETAETLLRQFIAKEDYARVNVIYILAVMLERKRVLVEKDVTVREDGTKIRVYEHKKTGEVFAIPDPELKLGELASVQQEVLELLGIAPPPAAAPAPAESKSEEPPLQQADGK